MRRKVAADSNSKGVDDDDDGGCCADAPALSEFEFEFDFTVMDEIVNDDLDSIGREVFRGGVVHHHVEQIL